MKLRDELLEAVEDELRDVAPSTLSRSYERQSERYRTGMTTDPKIEEIDVVAYIAARMPATLASVERVLFDVRRLVGDWSPTTMLDIGAGPGTASWAAAGIFSCLEQTTQIERTETMVAVSERLGQRSTARAVHYARRLVGDVRVLPAELRSDLVVASYVLCELDAPDRWKAIESWWNATEGVLVIIEPGTPEGAEGLTRARELLATRDDANVIAPCASGLGCASAGKWCHFSVRVPRSQIHRTIKSGTLPHEDEKYSYLSATRLPVVAADRIVEDPKKAKGHVRLLTCGPDGARDEIVSRRDADKYKWARKARWGDPVVE